MSAPVTWSENQQFNIIDSFGPMLPHPLSQEAAEALAFIVPLSADYPGIDLWFRTKVAPGLVNGTRYLHRVERDGQLIGLGIAKRETLERKICTVRIAPSYAGRGVGVRIFDNLLKWLDTDHPHLTVNERKIPAFERIFDWYGFNLTSVRRGIYVPNVAEYAFNEAQHSGQVGKI